MKIEENISKLIAGTKNGKIVWEKKNPTTYNWKTKSSEGVNVNTVVQKFNSTDNEIDILFRLWNLDLRYSFLDLKYQESSPEIKSLLKELYETISGSASFDDIFSDILKDI